MFISIHTVFYFSSNFQTTRHCAEQWSHGVLTKRSLNLSEIEKPTAGPLKIRRFRSLETIVVSGYLSVLGKICQHPFFLVGAGDGEGLTKCYVFFVQDEKWNNMEEFTISPRSKNKEKHLGWVPRELVGWKWTNQPARLHLGKSKDTRELCATNVSKLAWYQERYFYNGTTKI